MTNDERKWVHPLALKAINTCIDDRVPEVQEWYNSKAGYLTDQAKAILEAVEKAIRDCEQHCPFIKECDLGAIHCEFSTTRHAWKGNKS